MFVCNKLLLGLTGSISTLLMPYNIFFLRQKFAQEVNVIMTYTAQQLITPYAIELCSGAPVFTRHTQISDSIHVPHIELPADSDLFLIMPATANASSSLLMMAAVRDGRSGADEIIPMSSAPRGLAFQGIQLNQPKKSHSIEIV